MLLSLNLLFVNLELRQGNGKAKATMVCYTNELVTGMLCNLISWNSSELLL